MQAQSSPEKLTSTSSPTASPAKTTTTATVSNPATQPCSPAGAPPAQQRACRRDPLSQPSAPTPEVRFASPPHSADLLAIVPLSASAAAKSAGPAPSISHLPSTP